MVKTAEQRKPTAPVAQDEIERSIAIFTARKQFMSAAMNMGWQLAGVVLVPVIVGAKLDDHFHTSPSYTLSALIIAVGGAVWVVWTTIKQVGQESATGESSATADNPSIRTGGLRVKKEKK